MDGDYFRKEACAKAEELLQDLIKERLLQTSTFEDAWKDGHLHEVSGATRVAKVFLHGEAGRNLQTLGEHIVGQGNLIEDFVL